MLTSIKIYGNEIFIHAKPGHRFYCPSISILVLLIYLRRIKKATTPIVINFESHNIHLPVIFKRVKEALLWIKSKNLEFE